MGNWQGGDFGQYFGFDGKMDWNPNTTKPGTEGERSARITANEGPGDEPCFGGAQRKIKELCKCCLTGCKIVQT